MLNRNECANCWKKVIECYDKTRDTCPRLTVELIVESIGLTNALEVFSMVARIKIHDGRIYGANREFTNSYPVDENNIIRESGNPMISADLDKIHTTHINHLITELREFSHHSAK